MHLNFPSLGIKLLIYSFIVVALIFIPILFWQLYNHRQTPISPLPANVPQSTDVSQPTTPPLPTINQKNTLGIILLGYGGPGHDGAYLTDAIQLMYLDYDQAVAALISIPRDLLVRSPNGQESKINAVLVQNAIDNADFWQSGAKALKNTVSSVTGLQVNYFMAVDFTGTIQTINQYLQSIEVYIAEPLDDPWYPDEEKKLETCGLTQEEIADYSTKLSGFELEKKFPCRYKHIHFDKGSRAMEGEEVLIYVRSRHGSVEGDVSRGKRQQEVIIAIVKKILALKTDPELPEFFSKLATNMETDITKDIVTDLLPAIGKAKDFKQLTINLSPTNVLTSSTSPKNGYVMIPKDGEFNWTGVQSFIREGIEKDKDSN